MTGLSRDSRPALITLVRHGETDWNRQKRIQGTTDIPLNETGIAQARDAAAHLSGAGYAAVYASPLSRALHTARIIAGASGLPEPRTYADLRERAFGEGDGLTDAEFGARFGADVPGRETRAAVVQRVLPVLEELAQRHAGSAVLVVTHGAVISSLARHLTGGELPRQGEAVLNLSVNHFHHERGVLRIGRFNTPAHDELTLAAVAPFATTPRQDAGESVSPEAAARSTSSRTPSSVAADAAQV